MAAVGAILDEGAQRRQVAATKMNEYSSRSHTIFRVVRLARAGFGEIPGQRGVGGGESFGSVVGRVLGCGVGGSKLGWVAEALLGG